MSMSVANGGSGFHLMSRSVYLYICGKDIANIHFNVDEIPDAEIRAMCDEVMVVS